MPTWALPVPGNAPLFTTDGAIAGDLVAVDVLPEPLMEQTQCVEGARYRTYWNRFT